MLIWKRLWLSGLVCLLLAGAVRAGETVAAVNFTAQLKSVREKGKGSGSFIGMLPENCVPNFGWNASVASTRSETEKGRKYLRLNVAHIDQGIQFYVPIPKLEPGSYRLSFVGRLQSGCRLRFGLRLIPPPWSSFWGEELGSQDAEGGWIDKNFVFTFADNPETGLGIFLYPMNSGSYDLVSLKLERMTDPDFLTAVPRPAADCRNFFRNSRLPLGLQAGWSPGRENEAKISADAASTGPSGFPPLRLDGTNAVLYSEPFQTADPLAENHVSVAARGDGSWRMELFYAERSNLRKVAGRNFQASAEWKTETLNCKLNAQAKAAPAFVLKISGSGKLDLDAFQAWAGAAARVYRSQGECEAALSLPPSECSEERIVFADEPAKIDYCVTGDFAGGVLKLKAVNAWGRMEELPPVKLDGEKHLVRGTVDFNAFAAAPLGQFRIEAEVERGGRRISPCNELLLTRLERPVHWTGDAPDSPFGTHALATPLTIRLLKAAGINWVRLHDAGTDYTGWYHLEREKGRWTFRDREIRRYRDAHIKILGGLQTAPPWASYFPVGEQKFNEYFDRYFEPRDLNAWANYVTTVVKRYRGVIDDFFLWNEPWHIHFWHVGGAYGHYKSSADPAGDYARISEIAYRAAKKSSPEVRISGFNSTNGTRGIDWTRKVCDAGAFPYCDTIDYHEYNGNDQALPFSDVQSGYKDAVGSIERKEPGGKKPVYMTEGQGNTDAGMGRIDFGLYRCALPFPNGYDPALTGDRTCRFVIDLLAAGCSKVFLYSAHCYTSLAVRGQFTAIVGADGYPSVETAAFSHMARRLEDTKFVRTVQLTPQINAYVFQGRDRVIAAISGVRTARLRLPTGKDWEIADLFGNPSDGSYCGTLLYVDSKLPPRELIRGLLRR